MRVKSGRVFACWVACSLWVSNPAVAADEAPSRELLEFLGSFELKDDQVVDMMLDEQSGKTINVSQTEETGDE